MTSVKCPICSLTNWSTDTACKRCKRPLGLTAQATFSAVPYAYEQPKLKIGMAITSMVFGLAGCFILSPIGLVLGIISTARANRRSTEYGGLGFGVAGIVLNALGVLTIPIVLAIAIPNLLAASRMANEASAIKAMRQLASSESTYTTILGSCGELSNLGTKGLVDGELAKGQKNGYRFMVVSTSRPRIACEIYGTPNTTNASERSFYISTEDNILRAAQKNGDRASLNDPPVDSNISQQRESY
ncbi:MAG: hypothetical protein ABI999_13065 [Acidobacteriota bacterium]